ncbi:hypothetical protein AX16_010442 [Volvariella volvacea WC 439]|nr:hypothetical protein AX16_010442 [Volvariella volvacea WC 439]
MEAPADRSNVVQGQDSSFHEPSSPLVPPENATPSSSITEFRAHNAALPIYCLPDELLLKIIVEHQLDVERSSLRYSYDWIRVTHVSHHWRVTALDSPTLWSAIHVPPAGPLLTEELLRRSSPSPLSTVCLVNHEFSDPRAELTPKLFSEHLRRIQDLTINDTTARGDWVTFFERALEVNDAPLLRSIRITIFAETELELRTTKPSAKIIPNLFKLHLEGGRADWLSMSQAYPNLTSLSFSPLQSTSATIYSDFLSLLRQGGLPNLEFLTLGPSGWMTVHPSFPLSTPTPDRDISLPKLRSLTVEWMNPSDWAFLISCLDFPRNASVKLMCFRPNASTNPLQMLVTTLKALVDFHLAEPSFVRIPSPYFSRLGLWVSSRGEFAISFVKDVGEEGRGRREVHFNLYCRLMGQLQGADGGTNNQDSNRDQMALLSSTIAFLRQQFLKTGSFSLGALHIRGNHHSRFLKPILEALHLVHSDEHESLESVALVVPATVEFYPSTARFFFDLVTPDFQCEMHMRPGGQPERPADAERHNACVSRNRHRTMLNVDTKIRSPHSLAHNLIAALGPRSARDMNEAMTLLQDYLIRRMQAGASVDSVTIEVDTGEQANLISVDWLQKLEKYCARVLFSVSTHIPSTILDYE